MKPHNNFNITKDYDHADKKARGIAFTIDHNGAWYTHSSDTGTPGVIGREKLVKLFAGAGDGIWAGRGLKYDTKSDKYTIATPHVSYDIEVEDLPFIITDFGYEDGVLTLTTQLDEIVEVSKERPLRLSYSNYHKRELPEIEIRKNLRARLSRKVYHDLVASHGKEKEGAVMIESNGSFYSLGTLGAEI